VRPHAPASRWRRICCPPISVPIRRKRRLQNRPHRSRPISTTPGQRQIAQGLAKRRPGQPFAFWFGSNDPHRPYEAGSGAKAGLRADRVAVPGFFPDTPEVRSDVLDYLLEVQRFDSQVAALIEALEKAGELDNTIVVVTSDNGMPFPRAKANLYDWGVRMPLAIRWPGRGIMASARSIRWPGSAAARPRRR